MMTSPERLRTKAQEPSARGTARSSSDLGRLTTNRYELGADRSWTTSVSFTPAEVTS
jgi:hypothetical protein